MKKLNDFLMKNSSFPLLTALLCAAVFAGGHMYVVHGFGLFADLAQTEMMRLSMETGDYASPVGFAAGFMIARVLEGPLVGILDIGGAIMTGVGTGCTALFMASGLDFIVKNFALALLVGALIGFAIGTIIILIKKSMPSGMVASGTNIMMGAGNATGRYLGPLIIIYAAKYSIPAGIGAVIGTAIFYKMKKEMVGGAIIGAMLLAALFPIPA